MKALVSGVGVLAAIAVGYVVTTPSGDTTVSPPSRASSANEHRTPPQTAVEANAPSAAVLTTASAIQDEQCDLEAVPTLDSSLDPRVSEMSKTTPFSLALDPQRALDRDAALQQVVAASSDPSKVTMAAVTRVPYSRMLRIFGGGANPLVAPTRCVWIVTVDGPFDIDSYPPGPKPPQLHGATMSIDAASGEPLEGMEGRGAPSLITGAHLSD
jgi:hypothetical protein